MYTSPRRDSVKWFPCSIMASPLKLWMVLAFCQKIGVHHAALLVESPNYVTHSISDELSCVFFPQTSPMLLTHRNVDTACACSMYTTRSWYQYNYQYEGARILALTFLWKFHASAHISLIEHTVQFEDFHSASCDGIFLWLQLTQLPFLTISQRFDPLMVLVHPNSYHLRYWHSIKWLSHAASVSPQSVNQNLP